MLLLPRLPKANLGRGSTFRVTRDTGLKEERSRFREMESDLPETKPLSIPKKSPDASLILNSTASHSGLGGRAGGHTLPGPGYPAFDFHHWREMSKKSEPVLSLKQTPFLSLATQLRRALSLSSSMYKASWLSEASRSASSTSL